MARPRRTSAPSAKAIVAGKADRITGDRLDLPTAKKTPAKKPTAKPTPTPKATGAARKTAAAKKVTK